MRSISLLCFTVAALEAASLTQKAPPSAAKVSSPIATRAESRQSGQKLYSAQCSGCHGKDGKGIGTNPALNTPVVKNAKPGALFWVLKNGDMQHGMPSFSHLPEQQRWQIVAYVKSL